MKFLLLLPQQAGLVATATIAGLVMSLNNSAIAQAPPPPTEGTPRPPYGAPVPPYPTPGNPISPLGSAPVPPPYPGV